MFTNDGSNFLNKFGGGFGPCARGDPTWPPWLYLKRLALARFNFLLKP